MSKMWTVFGAFLAWETRNVSIPALNDSQHVGLSVYNVLIMCTFGAAIALVLADHKDLLFVLISIFIIFCTTGTLCLVFVPKLLELRRNGQPGTAPTRIRATLRPASTHECRSPGPELERRLKELRTYNNRYRRTLQAKENELQMLLSKLGSDAGSESSTRDSKSPATTRSRLPVPKDNISHPDTSDITSVCSLSASAGAEPDFTSSSQQITEKPKPVEPPKEPVKEVKKEPTTKNVSFKNHLDYTSPPSSKAVPEKDQLAKLPYGWKVEEPSECVRPKPEQIKAETKSVPAVKCDAPVKSAPTKLHEPMYAKAATPKVIKTPELQKKPVKIQDSLSLHAGPERRAHRRMSSVGQGALLTDVMHVSVDQDDVEPPPHLERKVVGQERDPTPPIRAKQEIEDILDIDHEPEYTNTERRKSCQRRDSEKRKKEYIVVQSDLWDTTTFQYHTPMQRSVSEKTRQQPSPHHHREPDTRSLERRTSNSSINHVDANRGGTPEGYREAETLRVTDRGSKRRGSELPQPVSTPPNHSHSKRRQSAAQVRTYHEDKPQRKENATRRVEELHKKAYVPQLEVNNWRPDPDTIRVVKNQESPAKRLKHEAEPLKRAKGAGESPRLTQATHQTRPDHHKSSPNVASRHKSDSPKKREDRKSAPYGRSDSKRQDSAEKRKMYTASSESELFECAILPIFHKLLTERHKSQPHSLNLSYGVSCPNISIKCDIVEYL